MASQTDLDDVPETTSSDFSEEENGSINHKAIESDEFDVAFSETQKILKLKPSQAQQNAEQTIPTEPNVADEDDTNIAIQSELLADYLKPTNILSKYQTHATCDTEQEDEEEEEEEEEEKEWKSVHVSSHMQYASSSDYHEPEEEKLDVALIAYDDLLPLLMEQADVEVREDDIITEDFRNIGWFHYLKMYIFGGCVITLKTTKLMLERDAIFKIAKLKFDSTQITHNRLLQTLWMKITDDTRQCDKTGSHWQQIGFQGNDPASDIRGSGLFGLLQPIYMIENYNDILCKIYLLSIHEHQHFPLMVVSFAISGIVLRLLRSCLVYNYINSNSFQSVIESVNVIYVALFYEFYLKWKNNSRVIINFDYAQKELEHEAFSNWNTLIAQLKQRQNEANGEQEQKLTMDHGAEDDVEFGVSKHYAPSKPIGSPLNSKKYNQYEI